MLPRPFRVCSQESGPRTPWTRWWLSHDIQPNPGIGASYRGVDLVTPGSQGLLRLPTLVIVAPSMTVVGGLGAPMAPMIGRQQSGYSGG